MPTLVNPDEVQEEVTPEVSPVVDTPVDENVYDELKPEDEIWTGGPTKAQVDEWKKQYGDIYVTSITPEKHIVWRTLTRPEYRALVKLLEQQAASGNVGQGEANLNNEESIAEKVILYPPYSRTDQAKDMAGVASLISQEAMEASGFVALEIRKL